MLPNNTFKIAILTQSHLSRNPRVLKEAIALSNKGFDITVLSTKTDDSLSIEDNNLISNTNVKLYYYSDVSNSADKSRKFKFRIIRKLALIALGTFNYQSGHSLGYGFSKLNSYAKEMNADFFFKYALSLTSTTSAIVLEMIGARSLLKSLISINLISIKNELFFC